MKKRALVMAGLIAITILASTRVARAQDPMMVKVPFDFVVGNSTLPAGEYSVKISETNNALLLVNRTDSTASVIITTNPAEAREIQTDSKLVFNRYGDRYFLSQVWSAGFSHGRQLRKSTREKESAQSAKFENQDKVTLVASLPPNHR
jgi:hypothetical protein